MSKISGINESLVEAIKGDISIAVENNQAKSTVASDIFTKNLPEGVTKEVAESLHQYASDFMAATAKVIGDTALPLMEQHRKLEEVNVTVPMMGKDKWSVSIPRESTFPVPGGNGATVTKYAQLTGKLETYAAISNRGVIKSIREDLSARALEAFSEK